ncbi:hypothetical protein M2451_000563 [Dysgonomonas sp. PFB1-18]|nr:MULTISPECIES: hypothetical protein [unclassified Dysgonomonas]MDH6307414.1 hypothetical protein [Dysgonomonas sp. PF1-14]MDH6337332.1 hypothetical protein [Dysgonomonas sp. PF1-16]MDH6379256.1 hypothetical protein [Dysgonomonas sp. PFB1-18]MDH6396106.1 hypothetical protein [Dysgonomonas sp. PF1-23]
MTKKELQVMYDEILRHLKEIGHPKYTTFRKLLDEAMEVFD